MKRIIFILFAAVLLSSIHAQTLDSVYYPNGRCPYYYYQGWYDTTLEYSNSMRYPRVMATAEQYWSRYRPTYFGVTYGVHPSEPVLFKGVAVLTIDTSMDNCPLYDGGLGDLPTAADTVFCFSYDTLNRTKMILTLARWDTATPKIWRLPLSINPQRADSIGYVKVFEVMFDHPVPVDADSTVFFIGTCHSQETESAIGTDWRYNPHYYAAIYGGFGDSVMRLTCQFHPLSISTGEEDVYFSVFYDSTTIGSGTYGFLPIIDTSAVDSLLLRASSANPDMGSAGPAEQRVRRWFWGTVSATPLPGYQFDHWNDGSRENPLRVQMVLDSVHYIASFRQGIFTVDADSYNKDEGFVTGGGRYNGFDTAVIEAFPAQGYIFSRWNDGDTSNARRVEVLSDTAFTAYFEVDTTPDTAAITPVAGTAGLFTLTPNPTTGEVTLRIENSRLKIEAYTITILDAAGHEVLRTTLNSQLSTLNLQSLPAGTYFVTLQTPTTTATQKLLLK